MDGEITGEELQSLIDADGDRAAGEGATDGGTDVTDGDGDPRIVDIRAPEAFARGHIPGSENIPAPELTDRVAELDGADRVVTVCPHGKTSVQAARLVGSYRGVDGPVESLRGGLRAWDGPITADSGSESTDGDDAPAPF